MLRYLYLVFLLILAGCAVKPLHGTGDANYSVKINDNYEKVGKCIDENFRKFSLFNPRPLYSQPYKPGVVTNIPGVGFTTIGEQASINNSIRLDTVHNVENKSYYISSYIKQNDFIVKDDRRQNMLEFVIKEVDNSQKSSLVELWAMKSLVTPSRMIWNTVVTACGAKV